MISARGALNNIKWPEIEGLDSFKGKIVHSAAWDERYVTSPRKAEKQLRGFSYDYSNKKIGVIGGGSSAIQIVPSLQKLPGTHISSFQRGRTWILPPFGEHAMEMLKMDHEDCKDHSFCQATSSSTDMSEQSDRKIMLNGSKIQHNTYNSAN